MDLQEYSNIIYNTEQKSNVNQFVVNGVELWPLYRHQTINIFRNPDGYYNLRSKNKVQENALKNAIRYIYYKHFQYKKFTSYLNNILKNESVDVLLYSKNATHSDLINGKWYDKFVDPVYELLQSTYKLKKIELVLPKDKPKNERTIEGTLIEIQKFDDYYLHVNKNNSSHNLFEVTNQINELTGIKFLNERVSHAFYEILKYKEIFMLILKRLNPRIVFLKCYYEYDSFGLVLAAKELGIKTVDVQHGKQGVSHPMYTHFSKIPTGGYKLLPDYFWNWGEESKYSIEKWQNNKAAHQPIVGGNLWLAKWKFSSFYSCEKREEIEFINSFKTYERIILYSTQPIVNEGILPSHIVESIQNSPSNWLWLIRVHPFQKLSEGEILNAIGKCNATIEIKYSTELPLYFLLKNVTHHIALWSSTCFEANEFDIPTIISHPFGNKLYEKHLKSNVFFYSIIPSEIIDFVKSSKKNVHFNYIETSEAIAKIAFQSVGLKLEKYYI